MFGKSCNIMQARNNARIMISGSLSIFSNRYLVFVTFSEVSQYYVCSCC